MRKVIKILFSIISSLILAAIILPLWIALMLYLPPVQNFVISKATGIISNSLGTTVAIDRIHIRPFNRLTLDGLYIEDLDKDTLLYAGRIDVGVDALGLLRGNFALGDVKLSDVDFNLVQGADSTSNLKKILAKLDSGKPKKEKGDKPFRLTSTGLSIENMSFHYNKFVIEPRDYGVNFGDIEVAGFSLNTRNVSVVGDSITMRIDKIALRDKSGFELNSLSAKEFAISGAGIFFNGLEIDTPDSEVDMEYLRLLTGTWKGYSDFVNEVGMESKITDSKVSFRTIGFFAPGLKDWRTTLHNVNGVVVGTIADMSGQIYDVRTDSGGDTEISLDFAMKGIPDIANTVFTFDIHRLHSNADDIKAILSDIARTELSDSIVNKLDNLGHIDMDGHFKGTFSSFHADARIKTGEGDVNFDLRFSPSGANITAFDGNVNVRNLGLGRMLESKSLGRVSVAAGLSGHFGNGDMSANTTATLSQVEFNGYDYNNISMNGYFRNKLFKGSIGSTDPNIKFDFDGTLDFNDSVPSYDFDMQLFNADLNKLNFNKRDSISRLTTRIVASVKGTGLDDLNGRIAMSDIFYVNHLDSVRTGSVVITGDNTDKGKNLTVRSSFADIDYRSRTSYAQVVKDIEKVVHYYMPTISARDKNSVQEEPIKAISDVNNFSLLNINIKEANNVAGIFAPGLIVAKGTKLSFTFNPDAGQLSLGASSEYIEYKNNFVSKLDINTRNQGDSINLFVRAADIYAAGFYLPNFSIIGALKENQVNATTRIQDKERDFSALVGIASTLGRDPKSGIPQVRLHFTPSNVYSRGQTWNIYTRGIVIDSTKIEVDNLSIRGKDQQLQVNGVAGRNKTDTLRINLSRFALHPISQMTTRMGYEIDGMTTGSADLISVMKDGLLYAKLNFDSVRLNDIPIPDGLFESAWDFDKHRARFMLSTKESGDTVLVGYYRPTDGRYIANLKMEGINMALLDPLLKGVISKTEGKANADIRIVGQKDAIKFNGKVDVPSITTSVDFLNVPYSMSDVRIDVKDNIFTLNPVSLFDPLGNSAKFNMDLNLSSFSNIIYKLTVRPENLLVMNTTSRNNELFYGKVFTTGLATIAGDKRGVNMDITATTTGNSEFYLPLSNSATMGVSDIITFKSAKGTEIDSTNYLVRKQMILDRKNKVKDAALRSSMNINLALNVTPNVDFQLLIDPRVGDILRGKGYGSLTLNINPSDNIFSMYGDYEIREGSYQFTLQDVISKQFTIEQGSKIMWTGEPADALLDVTAIYKLKAKLSTLLADERYNRSVPVECRIILGDRLSQPSISFNVTLPGASPEEQALVANELGTQENISTQFFFLLAANSFYPSSGTGGIGTSATSGIGYDILFNQIGNILSNDKFDIGMRYRQGDNKEVSDEFNIDFSTQLWGNRLLLEAEGNYDARNAPSLGESNRANNLTGDFYLTWLIDKAGNLRAKGFTRTIDSFGENQGLQESGIGMYYREDFNSFSDIIRNFKERFTNWGRKRKERKVEKGMKNDDETENMSPLDNETGNGGVSTKSGANTPVKTNLTESK